MNKVEIFNKERWQLQHWRTLTSVYGRSPYFEFYEPLLRPVFERPFEYLCDFNLASTEWLQKQLKLSFKTTRVEEFTRLYEEALDLRKIKPQTEKNPRINGNSYYQLFGDRNGFFPNLSILDLLFSEGPGTMRWIHENMATVKEWS